MYHENDGDGIMKKTIVLIALLAAVLFTTAGAITFRNKEMVSFEINPNPMDEYCNIFVGLQTPAYMYLRIETIEGEVVSDIFSGYADKEMYFTWDRYTDTGEYIPNGTYIMILSLDQRYTSTKKTLILK